MGPPPKTCSSKPSKQLTCLEHGFYLCYFVPHDNKQLPKLVHTSHPRRLPPSGLQTPMRILGGNPFWLHERLRVNLVK